MMLSCMRYPPSSSLGKISALDPEDARLKSRRFAFPSEEREQEAVEKYLPLFFFSPFLARFHCAQRRRLREESEPGLS